MSTVAMATPCERLPMRMISPLRTYHVTPLASRSRVMRRVTSSTVPMASPVSMTSPTPYWSSMIMNTPDRKSLTRLCAPKPSATPATPAEASNGPRGMPSSAMIVRMASVATVRVTTLRSSEPTVSTRWRWRSLSRPVALASTRPARPDSARRRAEREVIVATTRSMTRRRAHSAVMAMTMVSRMRAPSVSSHCWVCSHLGSTGATGSTVRQAPASRAWAARARATGSRFSTTSRRSAAGASGWVSSQAWVASCRSRSTRGRG